MEVARQITQIVRELMRLELARGVLEQFGIVGEPADQRLLVRLGQQLNVRFAHLALVREASFL